MKFHYGIIFSSSYLHESCWSRLSTVLFVASLPTALLQWIRVDQCHSEKKSLHENQKNIIVEVHKSTGQKVGFKMAGEKYGAFYLSIRLEV